ncbi:hypothetical protein [Dechloromonas denitrificans]|uniref:hypothetical protein n=1 Tax=Dechloromonas denitrificans TaxID=281362 RepID=UPI001CF88448|nr:hypothetical protein [Dechloromonas denitrificans]UCV01934.1 hypothetical protein KI611_12520 [Dechloromonas denitrificans]UCV06268.1 hypothetical protein KI615_12595 [Dechloromonas denitrificans]
MLNLNNILKKVLTRINRYRFDRELRQIITTPPITMGNDPFIALSMVHHRDVDAYLLAIKSFCRFLHPRRIIVVCDPSILDSDRSQISRHVFGVEFVHAADYREPGMPQGGCWERLIAISDFVQSDYVIQLDADTVSLSEMTEVRNAVVDGSSFVLATEDNQNFLSCSEASQWAKPRAESGEHIQILAESNLNQLPEAVSAKYVRGCAGFSGFAPGSLSREKLRAFSQVMGNILGEKWSAWGTEQFTSNFMVSNSPKARVLPHPKYCHPGRERPKTVFLHFIGYVRFNTGRYAQVARETCFALRDK